MTIVLFLLKIIGVVILIVLGIVLLVIAAVLFVPFHYQLYVESDSQLQDAVESDRKLQESVAPGSQLQDAVESDEKLQVSVAARVHWLLHFLGAEVNYRDGRLDAYLRILFWRKRLLNNEEAQKEEARFEKDAKAAAKDAAEEAVKPPEHAKTDKGKQSKTSTDKEQKEWQDPPKGADTDTEKQQKNTETNSGKEQQEESDGIIARISKIWQDFSDFRRKITRMAEDEGNHRAAALLKTQLLRLLKAIRPRKLSIDLEFSLGSPDLTGEVLGVCAWFPIFYQSGNRLIPDFEAKKAYAKGNADAKGRVYLFVFLFAALRILFDRDCKRMYRMFRKYF